MQPVVIFYTNCQGQGLIKLLAGQQGFQNHELVFLTAWQHARPSDDQIARCQILIYQNSFGVPDFLDALPAEAIRIVIPLITCAFMWPFTFDRPNEPVGWRFPYGDRQLIAKMRGDVAPETVATEYFSQDLGKQMNLNRLLDLEFQKWEKYDRDSDVRMGAFLKNNIFKHRLFFTPDHPTDVVMVELANQLLDKLDLPRLDISERADHLHALAGTEVPVHPSIIRHFALTFLAEDHQYPLWGGSKSLDTLGFYVSYCRALRAPSIEEALQEAVTAIYNHDESTALNICTLISLRYPVHPWAMTVLALISALNGQRDMACQLFINALPAGAETSQA
jgi:hypothetical protein